MSPPNSTLTGLPKNYREAYDLFAVNGILFNHESPRRGETFVTRKIMMVLVRIIAGGQQNKLFIGLRNAKRGHAKDYIHGMWLMLQQQKAKMKKVLWLELMRRLLKGRCLNISTLTEGQTLIGIDLQYLRPTEVEMLLGDCSKVEEKLGWEPNMLLMSW